MSEGLVVRYGVGSSWGDRQGRVFVVGFTLFQTRIKGLTSLL